MEEWRDISGYEDLYEVSNLGGVRRKLNGQRLYGNINSYGYRVIKLTQNCIGKDYKLHQLVAKAFIPNDFEARMVNHKDGNRDNNCVDNLEWCTRSENAKHAINVLGVTTLARPVMQLNKNDDLIAVWINANKAATTLNFNQMMILACCKGTALTAYDFVWRYCDFETEKLLKTARRTTIRQKIKQLSQELSTLR